MKKWTYHIVFKTVCLILASLSLVISVLSAFSLAFLIASDAYRQPFAQIESSYWERQYDWLPLEIAHRFDDYVYEKTDFASFLDSVRFDEVMFYTDIYNDDGHLIYSDYEGQETVLTMEEICGVGGQWLRVESYDEGDHMTWDSRDYRVLVYVTDFQRTGNQETTVWLMKVVYAFRIPLIPIFFSSLLLFFVLTVFLCIAAGKRGKEPRCHTTVFDRVFLEIYFAIGFAVILVEWWFLEIAPGLLWFSLASGCLFALLDALLLLLLLMTVAVRVKEKMLFESTLLYRLFLIVKQILKKILLIWEEMFLVPKIAISLSLLALFDLFLAANLGFDLFLFVLLVEGLGLMGLLIRYGASIQRIGQDQRELALGNLDHRCDLTLLPMGLRSLGEDLNRSAAGMEKAVEEKVKSERFKAELITNVSHDIKTPLTSIINYVDLLKKEPIKNKRFQEYLEVLERQSNRLKKLTEDLVESSKAASGTLSFELCPCDLKVLMEQAFAEYQVQLEEKGLTASLSFPDHPCLVMADGKRLWRVLDNVMNNICKYSLSGTRVLGTLEEKEKRVYLILRNISSTPLFHSGSDLTERFVRGDCSRNTEGSGLGLAISKSLVEMQNGSFQVTVDGDLFKVMISFDLIEES